MILSRAPWKHSVRAFARPATLHADWRKVNPEVMALNIMERRSKIAVEDIGKAFRVHTGREYVKVEVKEEMVGYRYSEFAPTKRRGPDSRPKPPKKRRL